MSRFLPFVSEWIATVFHSGYLPFAPGTWGSAVALLVWFLLPHIDVVLFLLIVVNLFLLGVITASIVSERDGKPDPPRVVIDEFVGMWIALAGVPKIWGWMALSFVLFRLFDITKIPPVSQLEKVGRGWGIMLDDVMAGIYAMIVFQLVYRLT